MSRFILIVVLTSLGVGSVVEAQWTYWVQQYPLSIRRANLDGTGVEVVSTELMEASTKGFGQNVVVDIRGGKMYWVVDSFTIRRANLDGSNAEDILTQAGDALDTPYSLAIVYPSQTGVPAVSTLGLGALALLVVGAGAYVMRKRALSAPLTDPQRGTPGA